MNIRILKNDDAEEFWRLRLQGLKEQPSAFGAAFEEEISIPMEKLIDRFIKDTISPPEDNFVLGAYDEENHLVGVVGFRRERRIKLRHKASVWGMYVAPKHRKAGVGKALMNELLKMARKLNGVEQINLGVVSSNLSAKNLYISLGFKPYGVEKNALKVGEQTFDEDLMVVFLEA